MDLIAVGQPKDGLVKLLFVCRCDRNYIASLPVGEGDVLSDVSEQDAIAHIRGDGL